MAESKVIIMNEALNEFYNLNCFTNETPRSFVELNMTVLRMQEISSKVLTKVQNIDSRFKGQEVKVGSYASGTTSVVQDECDMLLQVNIDGKIEATANPECVQLRLCNLAKETWKDCENNNGYFEPMLFSRTFYRVVEKALGEVKGDTRLYHLGLKGLDTIAATITYSRSGSSELCSDLVAAVQCSGTPPWQTPKWLDTKSGRPWPKEKTIKTIKERDIEIVAKPLQHSTTYSPFPLNLFVPTLRPLPCGCWRLSFSQTEKDLLNDAVSTYPVFGKVLVIFKALKKLYLIPPQSGHTQNQFFETENSDIDIFKTYHLKILLLHEAVEFEATDDWTEEKLTERFLSVLERFRTCIKNKFLPHLFLPSVNIFTIGMPPDFLLESELFTDPVGFINSVKNKDIRYKDVKAPKQIGLEQFL